MTTAAPANTTCTQHDATPGVWKPAGWQSLVPCLQLPNAKAALDFYQRAFGAIILHQVLGQDNPNQLIHATLRIDDSTLLLSDPFPEHGYHAVVNAHIWLYVKDADAAYKRAVEAGATGVKEVVDQFWGDRTGQVEDGFGVKWVIAQHLKVTVEANGHDAELQKFAEPQAAQDNKKMSGML